MDASYIDINLDLEPRYLDLQPKLSPLGKVIRPLFLGLDDIRHDKYSSKFVTQYLIEQSVGGPLAINQSALNLILEDEVVQRLR